MANKDVVPSLEAMQKLIVFYHDKDNDILKLVCTISNLTNICLQNTTDAKVYPLTEGKKYLLEKIEKMLLVVHLSFLHEKQLLMKLLIANNQTFKNLLLGLTLANYSPTRCVNPS